jgi:hypothetical protein
MKKLILINVVNIAMIGKYFGRIILADTANNILAGKHKNIKYNIVLSIYKIILYKNRHIYL